MRGAQEDTAPELSDNRPSRPLSVPSFCPSLSTLAQADAAPYHRQPMDQSARIPKVYAMLLCHRIIRDAETGTTSLIDLVENITVTEVPATVGTLYVYAKVTDAQGEYVFKLLPNLGKRRILNTIERAILNPRTAGAQEPGHAARVQHHAVAARSGVLDRGLGSSARAAPESPGALHPARGRPGLRRKSGSRVFRSPSTKLDVVRRDDDRIVAESAMVDLILQVTNARFG